MIETDGPRAAYDGMAAVYDRFTAHHDYAAWTAALESLARAHGLSGRRLLDVGCGTGKSFLPFLARGYEVVACDVSPAMAALAAAKAPAVPVHVLDARTLPLLGGFDLVTCLDDCLNHLLTEEDLTAALAAMAANLAPDGLLLFDLNTLATYRGFFAGATVVADDATAIVWTGETDPRLGAGGRASARLVAFTPDGAGRWARLDVVHVQRHHPEAVVRTALAAAGLTCVAVAGHGLDGVPHDGVDELSDTKAVYLARRARLTGEGR
jgi:SAM-dependent methyltransferase